MAATLRETVKVVAFDADDTLWDNEPYFRQAEVRMCEIMAPFGDAATISAQLYDIEMANMPDYGYGAVAFTMSMLETAVKASHGRIAADDMGKIIEAGRTLVRLEAVPLTGVVDTLQLLRGTARYRLVLFTKGELLTQEGKLKRSGLAPFFDRIFIVTDKRETQYETLCQDMQIEPSELLMVGNSLKSDILPALNIGAWAVHIPYQVMWQHEVIDAFEHPRMTQIERFSDLCNLL